MIELMPRTEYKIGGSYNLKLDGLCYRVTLMSIDHDQSPPTAHVIIREHSIDSFNGDSSVRRRHTKHSEAVPCTDVLLHDLW